MTTIARIINESGPAPKPGKNEHISDTLHHMFESMKIPMRLRDIVPDISQLEGICKMAEQDACAVTNPREASWEDLYKICKEAW